jgi:hypothetical protein
MEASRVDFLDSLRHVAARWRRRALPGPVEEALEGLRNSFPPFEYYCLEEILVASESPCFELAFKRKASFFSADPNLTSEQATRLLHELLAEYYELIRELYAPLVRHFALVLFPVPSPSVASSMIRAEPGYKAVLMDHIICHAYFDYLLAYQPFYLLDLFHSTFGFSPFLIALGSHSDLDGVEIRQCISREIHVLLRDESQSVARDILAKYPSFHAELLVRCVALS